MNAVSEERLETVAELLSSPALTPELRQVLRGIVDLVLETSYNPVREARGELRRAFKEDPAFLQVYRDNVACWIMDFEARRYREPSVDPGPMSKNQRDELAGIILEKLFDI